MRPNRLSLLALAAALAGCSDPAAPPQPRPAALRLDVHELALDDRGTATLVATVYDEAGNILQVPAESFTWSSRDEEVASVDEGGRVVAVDPGTTYLRVSYGLLTDSAGVVVRQVPTSIRISPAAVSIKDTGSVRLTATVHDVDGEAMPAPPGQALLWTSSVEPVATVDGSGLVTGHSAGATTIRAILGAASTEAVVTVRQVPTEIRISTPQGWDVYAGSPLPVRVVAIDRNGAVARGFPLRFEVAEGGGSVTPAEMESAGGHEPVWTMGAQYGPQLLRATSDSIPGVVAELRANAIVGPAQSAVDVSGLDTVVVGTTVEARVQVTSRYGLLMPNWPVQWDIASNGGGPITYTDGSGIARRDFTPTAPGEFSVLVRAGKGVGVHVRFLVVPAP